MKKKVVAFLLCVLIICTMSFALTACNKDKDNYVGTYVGYIEGKKYIQLFINIGEQENGGTDFGGNDILYYPISFDVLISDGYSFNMKADWKSKENGDDFYLPYYTGGYSYYLPSGTYKIGKIKNKQFTMTLSDDGEPIIIHCKKTNLSKSEWEKSAYNNGNPSYYDN